MMLQFQVGFAASDRLVICNLMHRHAVRNSFIQVAWLEDRNVFRTLVSTVPILTSLQS